MGIMEVQVQHNRPPDPHVPVWLQFHPQVSPPGSPGAPKKRKPYPSEHFSQQSGPYQERGYQACPSPSPNRLWTVPTSSTQTCRSKSWQASWKSKSVALEGVANPRGSTGLLIGGLGEMRGSRTAASKAAQLKWVDGLFLEAITGAPGGIAQSGEASAAK